MSIKVTDSGVRGNVNIISSEIEALKTNEFERRRRLRLLQVREQSKDIAKKLRDKAEAERLRQLSKLDVRKDRNYLDRQEKLVGRLESLYLHGLKSVGEAHRSASDVKDKEKSSHSKPETSKARARAAALLLKQERQRELNKKKTILDRKLQARKLANERNREKLVKGHNKSETDKQNTAKELIIPTINLDETTKPDKTTSGEKNTFGEKIASSKSTTDRPQETPLHQPHTEQQKDVAMTSQQTDMESRWEPAVRLQEPEVIHIPASGKPDKQLDYLDDAPVNYKRRDLFALSDEMPTSLRGGLETYTPITTDSRSKLSVNLVSDYLRDRRTGTAKEKHVKQSKEDLQSIKDTLLRTRKLAKAEGQPSVTKLSKSSIGSGIEKKKSVTHYNHATRATKDIPVDPEQYVTKVVDDVDAYLMALRESHDTLIPKPKKKDEQLEKRTRIAISKEKVAQEYKSTMDFLTRLAKESHTEPIKTAYMDDSRQKERRNAHQRKMQEDFEKVQRDDAMDRRKEQSKTGAIPKVINKKSNRHVIDLRAPLESSDEDLEETSRNNLRNASNLLHKTDRVLQKDPQDKPNKDTSNVVMFESCDVNTFSYNVKHTPPTKDKPEAPRMRAEINRNIEIILNNDKSKDTVAENGVKSDGSSRTVSPVNNCKTTKEFPRSESGKIILYKILDANRDKDNLDIVRSTSSIDKELRKVMECQSGDGFFTMEPESKNQAKVTAETKSRIPLEPLNQRTVRNTFDEGINRESAICMCGNKENLTGKHSEDCHLFYDLTNKIALSSAGSKKSVQWDIGSETCFGKKNNQDDLKNVNGHTIQDQSGTATTTNFSVKTAETADKSSYARGGGCVKVLDESGLEAGKFFIGASEFPNDEVYEVVIQLKRKGDAAKENNVEKPERDAPKALDSNIKETLRKGVNLRDEVLLDAENSEEHVEIGVEQNNKQTQTNTFPAGHSQRAMNETCTSWLPQGLNSARQMPKSNLNKTAQSNSDTSKDVSNYSSATETNKNIAKVVSSEVQTQTGEEISIQTQFNQRVTVNQHMSSSTSTAYLSPPDNILPKSLKANLEQQRRFQVTNTLIEINSPASPKISDHVKHCKKRKQRRLKPQEPPDTSSSADFVPKHHQHIAQVHDKYHKKPHKGDSCRENNELFILHEQNKQTIDLKEFLTTVKEKKSKEDLLKSHLSPIVQDYVNELLAISKDNRKLNELAALQCSSVTTPGSSIVNMPSNTDPLWRQRIDNSTLAQINILLKKQSSDAKPPTSPTKKVKISKAQVKAALLATSSSCSQGDILKPKFQTRPLKRGKIKLKTLNVAKNIQRYFKSVDTEERDSKSVYYMPSLRFTSSDMGQGFVESQDRKKNKQNINFRSKSKPTSVRVPYLDLRQLRNGECTKKPSEMMDQKYFKKHPTNHKNMKVKSAPVICLDSKSPKKGNTAPVTISKMESTSSSKPGHCGEDKIKGKNSATVSKVERTSMKSSSKPVEQKTENNIEDNLSDIVKVKRKNKIDPQPFPDLSPIDPKTQENIETSATICTETHHDKVDSTSSQKTGDYKLLSMEKIADLTQRCTIRLTNLVKVLEKVREHKPNVYTQITNSGPSDNENSSGPSDGEKIRESVAEELDTNAVNVECETPDDDIISPSKGSKPAVTALDFVPMLSDIPKPESPNTLISLSKTKANEKSKAKPPPALYRINFRDNIEPIVPHELSTVLEMDTPVSIKRKSREDSSVVSSKSDPVDTPKHSLKGKLSNSIPKIIKEQLQKFNERQELLRGIDENIKSDSKGSDALPENLHLTKKPMKMMDLTKFNDMMLKPFITLDEFARQCNITGLEETSNQEEPAKLPRQTIPNVDDISSLQSDGSLPDIVMELLKRNVVRKSYFKSDSNDTSTMVSSDSTLSLFGVADSKRKSTSPKHSKRKDRNGQSPSSSFSSNPDLEKAFEKLGMCWASSTLKKTREALALSSTTSTSQGSNSKDIRWMRKTHKHKADELEKHSSPNKTPYNSPRPDEKHSSNEISKPTTAAIKEFLVKELANKITFSNSPKTETSEQFQSLYSTKFVNDSELAPVIETDKITADGSLNNSKTNKLRTSTPVQLFKSVNYNSSTSSYNNSHGLFSNVDDLSSVKGTSDSTKHSSGEKDDLTLPNVSLRTKKMHCPEESDCDK